MSTRIPLNELLSENQNSNDSLSSDIKKPEATRIPLEELLKESEVKGEKPVITNDGITQGDFDRSTLQSKVNVIHNSIYNDYDLPDDHKQYLMNLRVNGVIDDKELEDVKKTLKGQQAVQQEDNWWTRGAGGAVSGAALGATIGSLAPGAGTAMAAGAGAVIGFANEAVNDNAHFYIDDKGIPRPLAYGERAPKGTKISSIYSSMDSAEDDSPVTAFAKSVTNSLLGAGKAIPALAQLITGSVTGDMLDNKFLNEISNQVDSYNFELDPKAAKQIVSVSEDGLSLNMDNMNWHSGLALVGQAVGSMASFLGAGKALGSAKELAASETAFVAAKRASLGLADDAAIPGLSMAEKLAMNAPWKNPRTYAASILISMTEAADAAERAGIKGSAGNMFALLSGIGVGSLELLIGGTELNLLAKRKIFTNAAKQVASQTGKKVATEAGEVAVEQLGKKGLQDIYNQIQKAGIKSLVRDGIKNSVKKMVGTGIEEGNEEFLQGLYSQAVQVLSDKFSGGKNKYGTDMFSMQSAADDLNNFLGGLAGAPIGLVTSSREENINQDIAKAVSQGKGDALLKMLQEAQRGKQISQQDYDVAAERLATMKEYHEGTKSITKDFPPEAKKDLLYNIFQKNFAAKKQAEFEQKAAADPTDAVSQAHADVYKQEVNSYQNKIQELLSTPVEKLAEEENKKKEEEAKATEQAVNEEEPIVTNSGFFSKKVKAETLKTEEEELAGEDSFSQRVTNEFIPEDIRVEDQKGEFSIEAEDESGSNIQYKDGQMTIDDHAPVETIGVKNKEGQEFVVGIEDPTIGEDGQEQGDAVIAMKHNDEAGTVSYARYTRNKSKVDKAKNIFPIEMLESALSKISGEFDRTPVEKQKKANVISDDQKKLIARSRAIKTLENRRRAKRNEESVELEDIQSIHEHFGVSEKNKNTTVSIENVVRDKQGNATHSPREARSITKGKLHIPSEVVEVYNRELKKYEKIPISEKSLDTYNLKDKDGNKYLLAVKDPTIQYEYEAGKIVRDAHGEPTEKFVKLKDSEGNEYEAVEKNGIATLILLNENGTASSHTQQFYYQLNKSNRKDTSSWDDLYDLKESLGLVADNGDVVAEEAEVAEESAPAPYKSKAELVKAINENQKLVRKNNEEEKAKIGHGYQRFIDGVAQTYKSVHEALFGKKDFKGNAATVAGTNVDETMRRLFAGEKISSVKNMSAATLTQIKTIVAQFQKYCDERGEEIFANGIILFDDKNKIAGEIDILTIDDFGNIRIYDIKTTSNLENIIKEEKGKVIYGQSYAGYQEQLSAYVNLFENQFGVFVKNISLLPIEIGKKEGKTIEDTVVTSAEAGSIVGMKYIDSVEKKGFTRNDEAVPLNFLTQTMAQAIAKKIVEPVKVNSTVNLNEVSEQVEQEQPKTPEEVIQENPVLNPPGEFHVQPFTLSQQQKLDNLQNRKVKSLNQLLSDNGKMKEGDMYKATVYPVISKRLTTLFRRSQVSYHKTADAAKRHVEEFYEKQELKISNPKQFKKIYANELREQALASLQDLVNRWNEGAKKMKHVIFDSKEKYTATVENGTAIFLKEDGTVVKPGTAKHKSVYKAWVDYAATLIAAEGPLPFDQYPEQLTEDRIIEFTLDSGTSFDLTRLFSVLMKTREDRKKNDQDVEESMIADLIPAKINLISFESFADKNFLTPQIMRNYIDKNGNDPTQTLDNIVEGTRFSTQDVIDFMVKYPSGVLKYRANLKNELDKESGEIYEKIKDKFGIAIDAAFAQNVELKFEQYHEQAEQYNSQSSQEENQGGRQESKGDQKSNETGTPKQNRPLIVFARNFNEEYNTQLKHLYLTQLLSHFKDESILSVKKAFRPDGQKSTTGWKLFLNIDDPLLRGDYEIKMYSHPSHAQISNEDLIPENLSKWKIVDAGTKVFNGKTYNHVLEVYNQRGLHVGNVAESNMSSAESNKYMALEKEAVENTGEGIVSRIVKELERFAKYWKKRREDAMKASRSSMGAMAPAAMFDWMLSVAMEHGTNIAVRLFKGGMSVATAVENGVSESKAWAYFKAEEEHGYTDEVGSEFDNELRSRIYEAFGQDASLADNERRDEINEAMNNFDTDGRVDLMMRRFKHLFVDPLTNQSYVAGYTVNELIDIAWEIAKKAPSYITDIKQYYIDNWPKDNALGSFWKENSITTGKESDLEKAAMFKHGFDFMHMVLANTRRYPNLAYMNTADQYEKGQKKGFVASVSNTRKTVKAIKTEVNSVVRHARKSIQKQYSVIEDMIKEVKAGTEIADVWTSERKQLFSENRQKTITIGLNAIKNKNENFTADDLYFAIYKGLHPEIGKKLYPFGDQSATRSLMNSIETDLQAIYANIKSNNLKEKNVRNRFMTFLQKREGNGLKRVSDLIDMSHKYLAVMTGIPAEYWKAYDMSYARKNGFDTLESYVAQKLLAPFHLGKLPRITENNFLESLAFVLNKNVTDKNPTISFKEMLSGLDPKASRSQVENIVTALKQEEEQNIEQLSNNFGGVGQKNISANEFLSSLTNMLEQAENAQEAFPDNGFVNDASINGVVIAKIDGVLNSANRESSNRGELNDFDRVLIALSNFVKTDHIAGKGRYLQMIDQQADSSSALYSVAVRKQELKESDVVDVLSSFIYYKLEDKNGTVVPVKATMTKTEALQKIRAEIDQVSKIVARYIGDFDTLVSSSDSNTPMELVEQFVYNWIVNKADLDNYLYGKDGKGVAYRESVKRKKDGKGMSLNKGIPGGVKDVQRTVVINDPKLKKIFFGGESITGEGFKGQDYSDGGILLMPKHNKEIQISSGGMFGGIVKAFTYFKGKDGSNNLLKGNDIALPDLNDPDAVDFYFANPFLKELVEWAEANNIDRIAFSSTAKLNKSQMTSTINWDIDEKSMEIRGLKLEANETTADHLNKHIIDAGKVIDVPIEDYRIMLDATNDSRPYKSKLPTQIMNILRSTEAGERIDDLISNAATKQRDKLLKAIDGDQKQFIDEILRYAPATDEADMLIEAIKNKSTSIHDPVLLASIERFFRNIIERKMLDMLAPKNISVQARIPGFRQTVPMTQDKNGRFEPGTVHVGANMKRSKDNPNGVEVGDYVIMTRVPTDDLHSVQLVKIGGFMPRSMKNIILGDQVSMHVSGHDVDGDNSHLWMPYRNINEKIIRNNDTYEGLMNSIFEEVVNVYKDPANKKRMLRAISTERVDKFKADMNLEVESLHPLMFTDWKYMTNANNSSKKVLSMSAAALKTVYNLAAGKVKARKIEFPYFNTKTKKWDNTIRVLEGWANGEQTEKSIAEMTNQVNYASDDGKNATLSYIGKDEHSAGIIDYVVSQNEEAFESVVMFLKHPVAQAYLEMKKWKSSPLGKSKKREGMNVWEATFMLLEDFDIAKVEKGKWTSLLLPSPTEKYTRTSAYKAFMKGEVAMPKDMGSLLSRPYNSLSMGEKVQILTFLKVLVNGSNDLSKANRLLNLNTDAIQSFGDNIETRSNIKKMTKKVDFGSKTESLRSESILQNIDEADFLKLWDSKSNTRARYNVELSNRFFNKLPIYSTFGKEVMDYIVVNSDLKRTEQAEEEAKLKAQDYDKIKSAFDQWRVVEALNLKESKAELFDQVEKWYDNLMPESPLRDYLKLDIDRLVLNPSYTNKVDDKKVQETMQLAFEALPQDQKQLLLKYQVREHGWTNTSWKGGFYHVIGPITKQDLQVKLEAVSKNFNNDRNSYDVARQIMKFMDGLIPFQANGSATKTEKGYEVHEITDGREKRVSVPLVKIMQQGKYVFFEENENGLYDLIGEVNLNYEFMPVFDYLINKHDWNKKEENKNPKTVEDILAEYSIEQLQQAARSRSKQELIRQKDFETIKFAYNHLKAEEKYDEIKMSNDQLNAEITALSEKLKLTTETRVGDVLNIYNDENASDYKVKVLEITRYNDYAILKVKTAKNKEYVIRADKNGYTKTGLIDNFKFKAVNPEKKESLKEQISDLKSKLIVLKIDPSDYYIDYFEDETPNVEKEKKYGLPITPIQDADKKAIAKASISNKFIGYGEGLGNSSTEHYRKQSGKNSNTGIYDSNDVVFVSVPGKRGDVSARTEQQNKTIKEALKAIEAGATLITDNKEYTDNSSYNEGEKRLAKNLLAKGYLYSERIVDGQTLGVWNKKEENKNSGEQLGFDFLKDNGSTDRPKADPRQAEKIRTRLAKLFPHIKFFTNAQEFQAWAKKNGVTEQLDMTALGARFKNAYWINPDKAHQEAYFHENAHIYWDMLSDSDLVKQRLTSMFNGDVEAAVTAIGQAGAHLTGPMLNRFVHYMKLFWARVKQAIWNNASAEDYARIMADRMWKGKGDLETDMSKLAMDTFDYMKARPSSLVFTDKAEQVEAIKKFFAKTDLKDISANDVFYKGILKDLDPDKDTFMIELLAAVGAKNIEREKNDEGVGDIIKNLDQFVQDILGQDITAVGLENKALKDDKLWGGQKKKIIDKGGLFDKYSDIMDYVDGLTLMEKAEFEAMEYDELKEDLKRVEEFIKIFSSNASSSYEHAPSMEPVRAARTILLARLSAIMLQRGMNEDLTKDERHNRTFIEAVHGMTVLHNDDITSNTFDSLLGKSSAGTLKNPNHIQNRVVQLSKQIMDEAVQRSRASHIQISEAMDHAFGIMQENNLKLEDVSYVIDKGPNQGKYYIAPGSTAYDDLVSKSDAKSKAIIKFANAYHEANLKFNTMEILTEENSKTGDGLKRDRVAFIKADIPELIKRHGFADAMISNYYGDGIVDLIHTGVKDANGNYLTLQEYKNEQMELRDQKKITLSQYTANIKREQHKAEKIFQGTSSRDAAERPVIRNKVGSMIQGIQFEEDINTALGKNEKDHVNTLKAASDKYFTQMSFIKELGDGKVMIDFTETYLRTIDGRNVELATMVKNINDSRLYAKGSERSNVPMKWQRTMKVLLEMTGLRFLALNLPAAFLNAATGVVQNIREIGLRNTLIGFYRIFGSHFRTGSIKEGFLKSKFTKILNNNGIVEITKDWSTSDSTRAWGKLKGILFSPIAFVEFMNHGVTMAGMMSRAQWEAYDENGNVIPGREKDALTDAQWISLIYRENEYIHGAYHTFNRRLVSSTPEGRALIQMRTWMPSIFQMHFGEDKYVGATDSSYIGSVTATIKNGKNILNYAKAIATMSPDEARKAMDNIPRHHKDAMMRMVYEVSMMAVLMLAAASFDDDDKNEVAYKKLTRLVSDLGFIYDLNNFTSLLKQPAPIFSTIIEILDTTKEIAKTSIGQGSIYQSNSVFGSKGDSKLGFKIVGLLPGAQAIKSAVRMSND